ncbi:MAG: protein tyrosine kinase modulator [Acidimicrobiaceae bacterium]|jgi:capsular polysaccharide biosynthesis protein|nr:protein tyrosine kinase modulator [Acidimicrobiaceae bacterium]
MELRRYLLLLRQRLVLVVVTVLAGIAGGYLVTNHIPIYRAQTSIYVGSRQASNQSGTDIIQLDRIIATYAAMVKSTPVAQGAIAASHAPRTPGQVIGETTSVVLPNTNLIAVSVADSDPAVAQSLANGVVASFIAQVQNLSASTGAGTSSTPSVSVFQQAGLPGTALPTPLKRDLALGALFGLIVSVGVVFVVDYLDISIKSAEDLQNHSDFPVLGTIPLGRPGSAGPLPMAP